MSEGIGAAYLFTAICFVLSLKLMNSPKTARFGNGVAVIGMAAAIAATFFLPDIGVRNIGWIVVSLAIGAVVGVGSARKVQMTAMPQMVALFNGLGGGAVALVATVEFSKTLHPGTGALLTMILSTMIGAISFSGSLIAFGKLQELLRGGAISFPGQKIFNLSLLSLVCVLAIYIIATGGGMGIFALLLILSLATGALLVLPIGGADMPVVISLLNSFTGVAAALAGFVLNNTALLIGGGLVGASGLILTLQMCKAMNRSLDHVIFGALGGAEATALAADRDSKAAVRSYSIDDAAIVFANADSVIIVPGYGMAVAQAQHAVKEFADKLAARGSSVKYAIHPVAGRMPGHMNVLLAEADVPYDQLYDLDDINPEFPETDIALVIGANDVTNPAARYDQLSPIYGMPILDVDKAKTCIVCKRSMNPGYAGIDNELYTMQNTVMLFGDAKSTIQKLSAAIDNY